MKFYLFIFPILFFTNCKLPESEERKCAFIFPRGTDKIEFEPKEKMGELLQYCKKHNFNEQYGIIINFSLPSGD